MIKYFNKKKHLVNVVDFIQNNKDEDFYVTEDNKRYLVNNIFTLNKLLKNSSVVLISKEIEVEGILVLWKAIANDVVRYYVKLNAINESVANKLITCLIWNTKKNLYIKINKQSIFLNIFKMKGFRFLHDRGSQILLRRIINGYNSKSG